MTNANANGLRVEAKQTEVVGEMFYATYATDHGVYSACRRCPIHAAAVVLESAARESLRWVEQSK